MIPVGVSLSGAGVEEMWGGVGAWGPFLRKIQFGVDAPVISGRSERIGIWDGGLVTHGRHDMALPREGTGILCGATQRSQEYSAS